MYEVYIYIYIHIKGGPEVAAEACFRGATGRTRRTGMLAGSFFALFLFIIYSSAILDEISLIRTLRYDGRLPHIYSILSLSLLNIIYVVVPYIHIHIYINELERKD